MCPYAEPALAIIAVLCLLSIAMSLSSLSADKREGMSNGCDGQVPMNFSELGVNNLVAAAGRWGSANQRIAGSLPSASNGPQASYSGAEFASNPVAPTSVHPMQHIDLAPPMPYQ